MDLLQPGQTVTVSTRQVTIIRYLNEGGFAHVYLVKDADREAVLKRIRVIDRDELDIVRKEVDSMKRVSGHRHVVNYIDSHAARADGGGFEVFVLMDYCSGGGLIDVMNGRLKDRFSEQEIKQTFYEICLGVSCLHYLSPPLLHRDLKIENVLQYIPSDGSLPFFKLCDFGSASNPKSAVASDMNQIKAIEYDIQKYTTAQYRAPEMIDPYRYRQSNNIVTIDEKSDIWALGILLYKLCYYITPFEAPLDHSATIASDSLELRILNNKYIFQDQPRYSNTIRTIITWCLKDDPRSRPNIYQLVKHISSVMKVDCPLQNIYESKKLPVAPGQQSQSTIPQASNVLISYSSSSSPSNLPQVEPMRRGRPSRAPTPAQANYGQDPFGLQLGNANEDSASKYPSIEQFSLPFDSNATFDFGSSKTKPNTPVSQPPIQQSKTEDSVANKLQNNKVIQRKVVEKLADDAFTRPDSPSTTLLKNVKDGVVDLSQYLYVSPTPSVGTRNQSPGRNEYESNTYNQHRHDYLNSDSRSRAKMVSVGTMTSPTLIPCQHHIEVELPPLEKRPSTERHTNHALFTNPSRTRDASPPEQQINDDEKQIEKIAEFNRMNLQKSERGSLKHKSSYHKSQKSRHRSMHIESSIDFLKELDSSKTDSRKNDHKYETNKTAEEGYLDSNVEFLKTLDHDKKNARLSMHRTSSVETVQPKHQRKVSSSNIGSVGKSSKLGKFGDVFRKFEYGGPEMRSSSSGEEKENDLDDSNQFPNTGKQSYGILSNRRPEKPPKVDTADLIEYPTKRNSIVDRNKSTKVTNKDLISPNYTDSSASTYRLPTISSSDSLAHSHTSERRPIVAIKPSELQRKPPQPSKDPFQSDDWEVDFKGRYPSLSDEPIRKQQAYGRI